MLKTIKQRLGRDDEQGFTLIELMVVLLIIAILLAIAIPTFLGARGTANARSTQSNLRNALTAEQTQWTNAQAFAGNTAAGATTMQGIEPALQWTPDTGGTAVANEGGNTVLVALPAANQVELTGYAKDGHCYTIFQSNDPANDFTAYYQTPIGGGPTASPNPTSCATPTAPANQASLTTGSAASNPASWTTSF
jgi:type IV pilus assembly protein PilA